MEETGIEPATRTLQGSVAPLEHALPYIALVLYCIIHLFLAKSTSILHIFLGKLASCVSFDDVIYEQGSQYVYNQYLERTTERFHPPWSFRSCNYCVIQRTRGIHNGCLVFNRIPLGRCNTHEVIQTFQQVSADYQ